jgi:hypothetical protein
MSSSYRHWLRFHLSTCVLATCMVGLVLYLNMLPRMSKIRTNVSYFGRVQETLIIPVDVDYGWPVCAVRNRAFVWTPELVRNSARQVSRTEESLMAEWVAKAKTDLDVKDVFYDPAVGFVMVVNTGAMVDEDHALVNLACGGALVVAFAIAIEALSPRRSSRTARKSAD